MKPWNNMQFELEEVMEKILSIENPDKELEDVGTCVLMNIAICKDINDVQDFNQQQEIWNNVKTNMQEIMSDIFCFLKDRGID